MQQLGRAYGVMADRVTPLLKTFRHLPFSLRGKTHVLPKFQSSFPQSSALTPLCSSLSSPRAPPRPVLTLGPLLFLLSRMFFPQEPQACFFIPFRLLLRTSVLRENILGHPPKSPILPPDILFLSLLYFFSLSLSIIYLIHYLPTRFLKEHTQRTLPAGMLEQCLAYDRH